MPAANLLYAFDGKQVQPPDLDEVALLPRPLCYQGRSQKGTCLPLPKSYHLNIVG
jgi:hypothetical protein